MPLTPLDIVCHVPLVAGTEVVGCITCDWKVRPQGPGSYWFQFVEHMASKCHEGRLVLNEDDARLLRDMDAAFKDR